MAERRGLALFRGNGPPHGSIAYHWIREAMEWYEKAGALLPPGNDDALLRPNTCARLLMRHHELAPQAQEAGGPLMLE
jgi:hypothetical protein